MDLFCNGTTLSFQETKKIEDPWKSRINDFIRSLSLDIRVNRKITNETGLLQEQSLETLLSQKCGRRAFRNFLKSEFCEENLDFWLACEEFRTISCPEQLSCIAGSIYEEFIKAGSPKEMNLDFHIRDTIAQNLQQPSSSCLVEAQKKVYGLMENDAFPRFVQSDYYKEAAFTRKEAPLGKHRNALRSKHNVNDLPST